MKLTRQDVENIAHLARLEIGAGEIDGVVEKLGRIVSFVDQLQAADTGSVAPMAHPLDMAQRPRADEVTEANQREHFEAIAPRVEAGLYLVPKVIE